MNTNRWLIDIYLFFKIIFKDFFNMNPSFNNILLDNLLPEI